MKKLYLIASIVVVLIILLGAIFFVTITPDQTTPIDNTPNKIVFGPASDYLVFVPIEEGKAADLLLSGEIDVSLNPLTSTEVDKLKESNINVYAAPSQYFSIELNPAPSNDEKINPFESKEVRFALNNLIPKQGIVDELFDGYGEPKNTVLFKKSPDYNLLEETLKEFDFRYSPESANKVITEFMEEKGAIKVDNKWQYKEKPVEITYLIYGGTGFNDIILVNDYIADVLEETGFTLNRIYYSKADLSELSKDDAKDLNWNIIANGGIYYGATKYSDYSIISEAPYRKNLFGSYIEGNWNYENEELDTLGRKLAKGNYNNEQEWEELFKKGMEITLDEAYTVYVITREQLFAANKKVEGLTVSDFTSIRLLQNLREMNIPGKEKLIIGTKETYNEGEALNCGYFAGNIYRKDMAMALRDYIIVSNPKTLEYEPLRWNYEIETNGSNEKIIVPEDAFTWKDDKWSLVGKDINATTKISFDLSNYIGTNWHDGEKITWADILYNLQTRYESVYNEKWNEITHSQEENLEKYKGYRINGNKLEMYVDEWSFNAGILADSVQLYVWPWTLAVAEDSLVYNDRSMMYYSDDAKEYNVPEMRVVDKEHIQIILGKLDEMNYAELKKIVTVEDKVYVTQEEFNTNKTLIKKWAEERNNLVIIDGAFYLYSFDEETGIVTLKAVRDETYPFKKGDFLIK